MIGVIPPIIKKVNKPGVVVSEIHSINGDFYRGEEVRIVKIYPSGCYDVVSVDGLRSCYASDFEVKMLEETTK